MSFVNVGVFGMLEMYRGSLCADAASRMAGIASTDATNCDASLTVATRRSTEFSCSQ